MPCTPTSRSQLLDEFFRADDHLKIMLESPIFDVLEADNISIPSEFDPPFVIYFVEKKEPSYKNEPASEKNCIFK